MKSKIQKIFLPLCLSLLGMAFSLWNIKDSAAETCSLGCSTFADFSLAGFSLWWFGFLYFVLFFLLCLGRRFYFLSVLTALGLFLDTCLLVIMIFTVPCVQCLMIGSLIAISSLFILKHYGYFIQKVLSFLLFTWLLCFSAVLASLLVSSFSPWAISSYNNAEQEQSSIKIFFSPSCQHCERLVNVYHNSPDIAWYPIQQNEDDVYRYQIMLEALESGASFSLAYKEAKKVVEPEGYDYILNLSYLKTQFQLWRNASYLARTGKTTIPMVEIHGVPQFMLPESTKPVSIKLNTGSLGEYSESLNFENKPPEHNAVELNSLEQGMSQEWQIPSLISPNSICGDEAVPCDE